MSQADLAEAIGRSLQTVGKIERGKSAPSFETLQALGRVLEVPVSAFFQIGPHEAGADDALARIVGRLAPLPPEKLAWIETVIAAALRGEP